MNRHCVSYRIKSLLVLTRNPLLGETDRGRRITPEVTLAQTLGSSNVAGRGALPRTVGENGFSDDQQAMPAHSPIERVVKNEGARAPPRGSAANT